MAVTPSLVLPKKFDSSNLNKIAASDNVDASLVTLKNTLDHIFTSSVLHPFGDREYVYSHHDIPKWIVKSNRTGPLAGAMLPDTNAYRVRKARKIERIIEKHKLHDHMVVPKKYTYTDPTGKTHVIAQKLDIDTNRAVSKKWNEFIDLGAIPGESKKAHTSPLTPEQAEGLARCAFDAELTDLSLGNLHLTRDGKVAVLDTEPIKRGWKKKNLCSIFGKIFSNRNLLTAQQKIIGVGKLKHFCDDTKARKAIDKVENYAMLKVAAKLIASVALTVFVCSYAIPFVAAAYLSTAIASNVIFAATIFQTAKLALLTVQAIGVAKLYRDFRKEDLSPSIQAAEKMEQQGYI